MNKKDFIKIINGELWYKSDYAYWLYKQLEDRDKKIAKAIDFIKNNIVATETEEILLDILRGEEDED